MADGTSRWLTRSSETLCAALGERFFDLGGVAIAHGRDDVVGRLGPHHRRARLDRFHGIDHRRQHLVIDRDRLGRGLRRTRDVATTAATASPAKRTISWASSRRGGTVIGLPSGRLKIASVGMVPISSLTRSAPV